MTGDEVTLSTGHSVSLPLETEASAIGLLLPARYRDLAALLPDGLRPIRLTPRRGVVCLLAVDYHRIGDHALDPYDELAVVIAATPRRRTLSALFSGEFGGYVHSLPVTTEPARALGEEVWGFPKTVAKINHWTDGPRWGTAVVEDGEHVITLEIDRPGTWPLRFQTASYAVQDGRLHRIPVTVDGEFGARPFTARFDIDLGTHDRAQRLRSLGLDSRALARFAFEGQITYGAGRAVK